MLPEEKIARRFTKDHGLHPPFDIRKLVEKFADVEEDLIPLPVDAVLLGASSKRTRPLIILQRSSPPARKVFTLAHELGHVLIPWHIGTFVCNTDLHFVVADYLYREIEAEADRFASELLMPRLWIEEMLATGTDLTRAIGALRTNGVSRLAASFALIRSLPSGYMFAEVGPENVVKYSARSRGTVANPLQVGTRVHADQFAGVAEVVFEDHGGGYATRWWHFHPLLAPPSQVDWRGPNEVLDAIIRDYDMTREAREKLTQRVNGIIGHANNLRRKNPNLDLYTAMRSRFLDRPALEAVTKHPLFDTFLSVSAEQITSR